MVIADANGNGVLDAGEAILQTSPVPTGVRVSKAGGGARLSIDRWGDMGGAGLRFSFASVAFETQAAYQMALCVSSGGRLRTQKETTTCSS